MVSFVYRRSGLSSRGQLTPIHIQENFRCWCALNIMLICVFPVTQRNMTVSHFKYAIPCESCLVHKQERCCKLHSGYALFQDPVYKSDTLWKICFIIQGLNSLEMVMTITFLLETDVIPSYGRHRHRGVKLLFSCFFQVDHPLYQELPLIRFILT